MGKAKTRNPKELPKELVITQEEENYRILFDFAYYLENLKRGPVGGAIDLLRLFLNERKGNTNGQN